MGAGLLAVALWTAGHGWVLFTWAAVYGLSETGLPIWACFLIVGGVYLLIAVLLASGRCRAAEASKGTRAGRRGDAAHQGDRAVYSAKHTAGFVPMGLDAVITEGGFSGKS